MKEQIFLVGLSKFDKNFFLIKNTILKINENCEVQSFDSFDKFFFEQSIKVKPVAILFYEDCFDQLKSKRLYKIVEINGLQKPLIIVLVENINEENNNKLFSSGVNMVSPLTMDLELSTDISESIFLYRKNVPIRKKGKYAIAKIESNLNVSVPLTLKSLESREAVFETPIDIDDTSPQIITSPFINKIGISLDILPKNINQDVESISNKKRFALDIKLLTNNDLEKLSQELHDDILRVSIKKQYTEMQKKELMSSVLKKRAEDLKKQRLIELNNWYKNNKIDMKSESIKKILVIGKSSFNLRLLPSFSKNYLIYYIDKIEKQSHPLLNNMFFDLICINLEPVVKTPDEIVKDELFEHLGLKTLTFLIEDQIRLIKKDNAISRVIIYNNQNRVSDNTKNNWEQIKKFKLFVLEEPFSEKELNDMLSHEHIDKTITNNDKGIFPHKIIFDTAQEASNAYCSFDIFLELINEKEVIIKSKNKLPYGTVLKINYPIKNLYFTILKDSQIEQSNKANSYIYKGQITGLDQEQIKLLRAFIIKYQGNNVA